MPVMCASVSWFANEDTIRAPNKTVSSPINKGIFGVLDVAIANTMLECLGGQRIGVIVIGQPSVELGINMPDRFACIVVNSLLRVATEDGRVGIAWFAVQWLQL